MNNLQDNPLFVFLQREGFTEEEILTALAAATDIGQLAESLELRHPVLPGKSHPIVRVPDARQHFLEAKQALELL